MPLTAIQQEFADDHDALVYIDVPADLPSWCRTRLPEAEFFWLRRIVETAADRGPRPHVHVLLTGYTGDEVEGDEGLARIATLEAEGAVALTAIDAGDAPSDSSDPGAGCRWRLTLMIEDPSPSTRIVYNDASVRYVGAQGVVSGNIGSGLIETIAGVGGPALVVLCVKYLKDVVVAMIQERAQTKRTSISEAHQTARSTMATETDPATVLADGVATDPTTGLPRWLVQIRDTVPDPDLTHHLPVRDLADKLRGLAEEVADIDDQRAIMWSAFLDNAARRLARGVEPASVMEELAFRFGAISNNDTEGEPPE